MLEPCPICNDETTSGELVFVPGPGRKGWTPESGEVLIVWKPCPMCGRVRLPDYASGSARPYGEVLREVKEGDDA